MNRLLRIGLGLLFLVIVAALVFTYALQSLDPPDAVVVPGLRSPLTVHTSDAGTRLTLDAAADDSMAEALDVSAGIGYAHGAERGWSAALWRRTALGTLGAWLGPGLLPIDRHARRLGFARHAREAYDALAPDVQRHLQAYAAGMSAAFQTNRVRQRDEFVILNTDPAPWEPWHTLAVGRLAAWLATDLPPLPDSLASPAVRDRMRQFASADRQLRRWLHVHSLNRSVAWAVRDSTSGRTALFQRHVTGASASPLFQDLFVRVPGRPDRSLATIPGSLVLPTGTHGSTAWAHLLHSDVQWARAPLDSTDLHAWSERLTTHEGRESLLRVLRLRDALPFLTPPPAARRPNVEPVRPDTARADTGRAGTLQSEAPDRMRVDTVRTDSVRVDTVWTLRWPGLTPVSDVAAWMQQAGGMEAPSLEEFRLFDPTGLIVDAAGDWRVRGTPPVRVEVSGDSADSGGVLIGRSPWARYQADVLRHQRASGAALNPERWSRSDSSAWAGAMLPRYLPALTPFSDDASPLGEAAAYLRNWNATYDPASIGASIFDAWIRVYRSRIGTLPDATDSTYFAPHRRRRAFVHAVREMTKTYGSDLRQWRWERVSPDRRAFPLWSADSLIAVDLHDLQTTQYAPLTLPGRGHPSTLSGGSSSITPGLLGPAPASWDAWTVPDRSTLAVRHLRFDPSRFLARPFLQSARPRPVRLDQGVNDDSNRNGIVTRLRPPETPRNP